MLNEDKDFYEEISKKALYNTQNIYNSNKIVGEFKKEFINGTKSLGSCRLVSLWIKFPDSLDIRKTRLFFQATVK